jgi:hypothetical protein
MVSTSRAFGQTAGEGEGVAARQARHRSSTSFCSITRLADEHGQRQQVRSRLESLDFPLGVGVELPPDLGQVLLGPPVAHDVAFAELLVDPP